MKFLGTIFLGIIFLLYSPEQSRLEKIQASGELRVLTRYGLTTYYKWPNGKVAGLEYELAKRFAQELGVKLRLFIADDLADILRLIANNKFHLAAAGLVATPSRHSFVRFGPYYQDITQLLVYRKGSKRPPNNLAELTTAHYLNVIAGSHQIEILNTLKKDYPQLTWKEVSNVAPGELLKRVWKKEIQYALVDSNEVLQEWRFYPELQIGFNLSSQNHLAWAFSRSSDDNSLYLAAIQFFNQLQRTGELEQLIERYYGHINEFEDFDYYDQRALYRHIKQRLPLYRKYFKTIASKYHLDWRFLAAISYQESRWNPSAVSQTGVRGLMMLTKSTAREMGVKNRRDPFESIQGGARYFIAIKKRIPKEIQEPDKTWFTLAAYNVGLGHVRDARQITKMLGDNPNRWVDVKKHLPKLSQKKWYKQTKYGVARGHEPVQFVKNIRRFHDILVMEMDQEKWK